MGQHFISYSRVDARDFANRLADAVTVAWLDRRNLRPGLDWDEQIDEAIKTCESLLFVMTRDSVTPNSVCKNEWTRALKYRKPVIPLLFDPGAELPFRLEPRAWIDFTGDFEPALAELQAHLRWLSEPEGVLQSLKDRLSDAKRDLSRAAVQDQPRIRREIADLEAQIARQQVLLTNPETGVNRAEDGAGLPTQPTLSTAVPTGSTTEVLATVPPDPVAIWSQDSDAGAPSGRTAWEPGVLERAGKDLAFYIGPMAKFIVNRAAERAQSRKELYKALAAEIISPADRLKFLSVYVKSDDAGR
jgi:hypothetical protein